MMIMKKQGKNLLNYSVDKTIYDLVIRADNAELYYYLNLYS